MGIKKAQMETMGLVIIVVILAFVLIFVLQIITKPEQNNLQDQYLQLQANNLRNMILKTTLCQDTTIKDEILNCEFNFPS